MKLIRLKKLHVTRRYEEEVSSNLFDTEYDPDIDQCDLNKINEILHELVKNIANRNPLNTEFNIKSSASNKTR